MLIDAMYSKETGRSLESDNIHVISVGGTSFKRYMELARELGIITAVVRDNDKDYQVNCVENYIEHVSDKIKVFLMKILSVIHLKYAYIRDNKAICDAIFSGGRI
jgi:predicted ATP-dependent endonuclease of OLD family